MSYLASWMDTVQTAAGAWGAVALESIVKATVLLLVALAIARLSRSLSAARKHLGWAICIVMLLALPVLAATLPDWTVSVPRVAVASSDARNGAPPEAAPPTSDVARSVLGSPDGQRAQHESGTTAAAGKGSTALSQSPQVSSSRWLPELPAWSTRLFLIWIIGCAAVALWMVTGLISLVHTVRRALPLSDARTRALARSLASELGLGRAPRLLESHDVTVPMTCGALDPVIVLPVGTRDWSAARMRVVLLHELAHVKRRDCLMQLVAHAVCALYWFHPMVWYAAVRLRAERERACDDAVLRSGTVGADYASQLLDMARSFRSLPAGALAMARPSQLEGRLLAILAPSLDRRGISPAVARRATFAAACVALPLAVLSPRSAVAAAPAAEAEAAPVRQADDIIFHPRPGDPLRSRVDWAREEAQRRSLARGYWIAYAIPVLRDDGRGMITSGSEGWQLSELNEPSLARLLSRARAEMRNAPPPLDIPDDAAAAILLRYAAPSSELTSPVELKVRTLTLGVELEGRPVIWLGGASDEESLPFLTSLYNGPGATRIKEALVSSISVHRTSDVVVPFLLSVLESDAATDVRAQAAEGLGYHDTRDALAILGRISTGESSSRVREEAVEAMGEMRLPEATEALIELLETLEGASVRHEAVEALGEKDSDRAAAALAEIATSDKHTDVQREAVETLGEVPQQRGLPHLLRLARTHQSADVRAEVAETLAELPPSQTVLDALRRLAFEDTDVGVQKEAVESIAEVKDGAGRRLLDEIERDHPNAEVREEAREKKRGEE